LVSQTDKKLARNEQGTTTFLNEEVQEKEEATRTKFQEHAKVEFSTQTELFYLRFDTKCIKQKDTDTGFSNFERLVLFYDLVKDSSSNISYGSYRTKHFDCPGLLQPVRPRPLLTRIYSCTNTTTT